MYMIKPNNYYLYLTLIYNQGTIGVLTLFFVAKSIKPLLIPILFQKNSTRSALMYEHLFSCYIQNISYDEIYNDMYRLYLFCILKKCLIQKKNYLQIVYINNLCNICLFKNVFKKKKKKL